MIAEETLSAKEVDEIMSNMNDEQRKFLQEKINRSRKSKWLEVLAKYKGISNPDQLSDDELLEKGNHWELVDILDGGIGNRPFKCECGTPLRFQYIVKNNEQNKVYKLGGTCFENYTGLPVEVVKDIQTDILHINLDRDEILRKYAQHDFYDLQEAMKIGTEIPTDILEQDQLDLPLMDKQIQIVERLKNERLVEISYERKLNRCTPEQKEYLIQLPDDIRREILDKIEEPHSFTIEEVEGLELSNEILTQLNLGLPLLDLQMNEVLEAKYKERKRGVFNLGNSHFVPVYESNHAPQFMKVEKQTFTNTIDYDELMYRHLDTLKAIQKIEDKIPRGLREDWHAIQKMCVDLKNGEEFNYRSFRINLRNLVYATKVSADSYL